MRASPSKLRWESLLPTLRKEPHSWGRKGDLREAVLPASSLPEVAAKPRARAEEG